MPEPGLATLQRWLSHLVRHPRVAARASHGKTAAALVSAARFERGEIVKPCATMTPGQRVDVYGEAYFARLADVLRDDYQGVAHALGDEAFREVANAYARLRPSRHPNLTPYGARFATFVATRRGLGHRAFLRDLAELELAVVEAFHAPRAEPLDLGAFAGLAPEEWSAVVLPTDPSLRLVTSAWPVNRYLQAVFEDQDPAIPDRERSWTAVYRKDFKVWRSSLTREGFATLSALAEGQPFGAALEHAGDAAHRVSAWFRDWTADGLFVAPRT